MATADMSRDVRDIELDQYLPPLSLRLSKEMFGAGGVRTIHNDDEAARREGLPGAIAVGPQVASLIFRMMRGAFGQGWVAGGKSALAFRRPVSSDGFVTAGGRVVGKHLEGESVRIECEVWVDTLEGVRAVVGTASALVPLHQAAAGLQPKAS